MFLIDTNVISESRKLGSGKADPGVEQWLEQVDPNASFISLFTLFELELGVLRLERRDKAQGKLLRQWLDDKVIPSFADRVIVPDGEVALACARLHVPDPASERVSWIAATALTHGLTIVTRNVGDFARSGAKLINPWSDAGE